MEKIAIALLMAASLNAVAADTVKTATATWTAVAKRMDNTTMLPAELKGYVLQYQRNNEPVKAMDITTGLTIKIPNLGPGLYKFNLKAVDVDGIESEPSATFQALVGSRPAAPVLTITLTCDVGCTGQLTAP